MLWRAGFVLACLIHLYGVYWPRQAGPDTLFPYADKVAHLLLFGSVAFLGLGAAVPARWLLGALAVNAVLSEVIQHYLLPHRSGDPFDSLADLVGVAVGALLGFWALGTKKVAGHDMMGS
ncbi:VanZ family protein [Kribbella qitaiheensis]|uniref:VanZ family protein n=1 Tax=Kribbella qitaiheensis TaxID=1544730 RepID=A0A7G6XAE2_9ACTN|nr:VanZ family protein [Kribbella qitaiheensis]